MCAQWVKYCLLMILFIFSFICLYTPGIEIYGFGSFFVLECILAFFIFIDVTQDLTIKAVTVNAIRLPLWWILGFGALFEFLASFFMILTMKTIYKKFNSLQMSSENEWRLAFVKSTFVIETIFIFALILIYWNFEMLQNNGTWKMIILFLSLGIVGLSVADFLYANRFLQLINTITDG